MGHIFVPWRALKLCAQLRVPASRKCILVQRRCAHQRHRPESGRKGGEYEERRRTKDYRVGGKVEGKRQTDGDRRRKKGREGGYVNDREIARLFYVLFYSDSAVFFFFFCEVLTTSRSGCIGRPSAVELARYEQTLNASREKYPMCRLTYNAFRNVDTDSSSFMEEELIYCLVNGKRWVNS